MPAATNPTNLRPVQRFMKHWFAIEALPIVGIVSVILVGGSWFAIHSAQGPTIQLTRANPTPWNTIQPDEGVKLIRVNQKFDKTWSRSDL